MMQIISLPLHAKTVPELIEIALQLDVGMYDHLPPAWRNPGMAGLCAYRVLADALQAERALSAEVQTFLAKVESVCTEALARLRKEGEQARIKPLINQLNEYAGGFMRRVYGEEEYRRWIAALDGLPGLGQLVYRERDGRFFVLVDNGYIERPQVLYAQEHGHRAEPAAELNHAHFTINDGMTKPQSEKYFTALRESLGVTDRPLFRLGPTDGIVYLNQVFNFQVISAYEGQGKTNSRMKSTHQWEIHSPELTALQEKGIKCDYPDYHYHITFAEQRREPYPGLKACGLITEALSEAGLSGQVKEILISPSHQKTPGASAAAEPGTFQRAAAHTLLAAAAAPAPAATPVPEAKTPVPRQTMKP